MMTTEQKINEFLILSALEQINYDEIAKKLGVERKQLTEWEKENIEKYKQLAEVRRLYRRKSITKINIRKFYEWYISQEKKCFYCGISESEIEELIKQKNIRTKRLLTRGKKLELERRNPNLEYDDLSNLVFCCYWCNNAKTDEFTEEEFKFYIAPGIKQIWEERKSGIRTHRFIVNFEDLHIIKKNNDN